MVGVLQGDQTNMAMFFWYRVKSDANVHVYTGQVPFSKVPENTAMYNWYSCRFIDSTVRHSRQSERCVPGQVGVLRRWGFQVGPRLTPRLDAGREAGNVYRDEYLDIRRLYV